MQKAPPTPKGFRDIGPQLAKKRRAVIGKIIAVLEEFGFVPIETPTVEFAETLLGKYGEEEKLIYQFRDRGGRNLALRYDLTVPLARYVAANPSLHMPFSSYRIGQVFRGENPQHGRFREFTQFDFDTVGFRPETVWHDAEIILCTLKAARAVGLKNAKIFINHRKNFEGIPLEVIRCIDKIYKIGKVGVVRELSAKYGEEKIEEFLIRIGKSLSSSLETSSEDLYKIFKIFKVEKEYQDYLDKLVPDANLARGLDYYTGSIFELKASDNPLDLSIGAGGRYDNLIGMFGKQQIPAVGFSFGLDRLVDVVDEL